MDSLVGTKSFGLSRRLAVDATLSVGAYPVTTFMYRGEQLAHLSVWKEWWTH